MVLRLGLDGWDVADRLEEAAIVEPVHPFEAGELDGLDAAPRASTSDDLGLEQTDHRLGEGVVIGIPDAAHRGRDAGLAEALGVANGQVLRALSLWWIRPPPSAGRRAWIACSSASSTKLASA